MPPWKFLKRMLMGKAEKDADGRDQWPSRTAFVLAAMGGAIGLGNLLRYPSVVFHNHGAQWFIPYLIALFFLGIPILLLELSIGQAYRGGCVIAFNHISPRAKGAGLGVVLTGFQVMIYYVPILSWVMKYFSHSFGKPLRWSGRVEDFFYNEVVESPDPVPAVYDGGSVVSYTSYPSTDLLSAPAGWSAFVFFLIWLSISNGVGTTGRVVYLTMGLPIVMLFVLLGRGVSLPNAGRGIDLYVGSWNSSKLADGEIWQAALGQIFFSIGVGFGYFTSFASYTNKYSNAVQDTLIIGLSNSIFEVVAAFGVFGVIGYLDLKPDEARLGTFNMGFVTYPEAITQMPGSNFWAFAFFLTLLFLGLSSAFALLDVFVTLVCDSDWGRKVPRVVVTATTCIGSYLLSLMFCTGFGYYLLDAIDTYVNYHSLQFVVWAEIMCATTLYRVKDVIDQVGFPAVLTFNGLLVVAQVGGLGLAHGYSPGPGAGFGFGLFAIGLAVSLKLARTPDAETPGPFQRKPMLRRFYWIVFYSGIQLTRDLNMVVATGKNWAIPIVWAPLLKYVSAPILGIVFSFAYPMFYKNRGDPLHIFGFISSHVTVLIILVGLIVPKWFDIFVPAERRNEGRMEHVPGMNIDPQQETEQGSLEANNDQAQEMGQDTLVANKDRPERKLAQDSSST